MRTAPLPRDGNHETIYAASSVVSIQNVALNTSTFASVTAPSIYAKSLLAKTASGEECYISLNGTDIFTLTGVLSLAIFVTPAAALFTCKGSIVDTLQIMYLD